MQLCNVYLFTEGAVWLPSWRVWLWNLNRKEHSFSGTENGKIFLCKKEKKSGPADRLGGWGVWHLRHSRSLSNSPQKKKKCLWASQTRTISICTARFHMCYPDRNNSVWLYSITIPILQQGIWNWGDGSVWPQRKLTAEVRFNWGSPDSQLRLLADMLHRVSIIPVFVNPGKKYIRKSGKRLMSSHIFI